MAQAFDPYLNWLGVPLEEQPANCYRLLGLQLFESNPVFIDHAADERMAYLRQLVPGPQGEFAQKLLKEVWAARVLLLDPQKKAAYDAQLRQKMPPPVRAELEEVLAPVASAPVRPYAARRRRKSALPMVLRLLGLAAVGFAAAFLWRHFTPPMGTVNVEVAVDDRPGMELEIDGNRALLPEGEEAIVFRLAPGKHTFVLKRAKYEPCQEEVEVKDGETRTVAAQWRHYPRIVLQWPEPERRGAVIKIDGKPHDPDRVATTPMEQPLTLTAGEHQLRIEREGFQPFEQKLTLPPGEDVKVQPTWEAIRQTVKTPAWKDDKTSWSGLPTFQGNLKPAVSAFKADPNAPPEKQREPDPAAQAASRKRLEEKFNPQKASTAEEKLKLAKQIAAAAAQPQGDLADSYMLQRTAAQLFLEAGDLRGAMGAVDKLAAAFLIDDLTWRSSAIKQFVAGAADERRATLAVDQAKTVFDRYLADKQYEPAGELAEKLIEFCQQAKDRQLRKQMLDRQAEIKRRAAAWQQYTQAVETLRQKPDDAEANQTVGQWRCLVEGDWRGGLKSLGNSADSRLQAIARAELLGANTPQDQAKLGGMWFELSGRYQDDLRTGMRARAGYWYQKAYTRLPAGITKITLEKRLAELGMATSAGEVAAAQPAAAGEKPAPKLPTGPVVTTDNGPLDGRIGPLKDQLVAVYGSDAEMQSAADRGLKWLAEHQYPDGSWSFAHVLAPRCSGKCPNPGELYKCRNTATALALLALLGAGNTHESGPYAMSVTGGLAYLMGKIKLGPGGANLWEQGANYSHAVATTALCEAYAMTREKRIGAAAQQAIMFLCNCQQPATGSWQYDPRSESNVVLNGWQVAALRAAHMGRLVVPPQIVKGAAHYFEGLKVAAEETTVLRAAAADRETTAAALLSRLSLGWKKDDLTKGAQQLARLGWAEFDFEFNLYATPVLFNYGGLEWTVWSKALRQSLLRTQITEGHAKGSWAILDDPKFPRGGRHYSTCVALLCLEVYYRYLPVYREPGTASEKTGRKRVAQDPEVQWQPLVSSGPKR